MAVTTLPGLAANSLATGASDLVSPRTGRRWSGGTFRSRGYSPTAPRFSSPRQTGDRDPPLPVEREAGRSGWLTGNASHAEPSKIISEYRNDGCRRLAAIGTRSIKTPRSTGGHMSETKREYAASYRKSPMHTRFKKG